MNDPPDFSVADFVALVCALVMLSAFSLMPWVSILGVGASGARLLSDAQIHGAENDLSALIAIPVSEISDSYAPALFLILVAAVSGSLTALWGMLEPRDRRIASVLSLVSGLAGLLYYVLFFLENSQSTTDLVGFAGVGFWVALFASYGLVLQVALPRPGVEPAPREAVHAHVAGVKDPMRVDLHGISKRFGPVRANDNITLTFEAGHIHALLGENGAGKSTLMKILSGFYTTDAGQILLGGQETIYDTPAGAIAHGVGMLHQDPLDFAPFSVLENFIYGRPGGLLQNRRAARAEFLRLAERLGFDLDPDAYIDGLTIGQRQQLEILRLISLGVRVLILDEPTTGISAEQRAVLFDTLRRLAGEEDMNIVFVSHKLEEVEELCDDVAVLRHGRLVGTQKMPCPTAQMVAMMFGQELVRTRRFSVILGEPVLQVQDLTVISQRLAVEGLTLDVRASEVLGLAGLDGSGQKLFLQACAGLQRVSGGRVIIAGQDLTGRDYHAFARAGVAYGSAGRLEEGLVGGLTLAEHFALADPAPRAWIDWRHIQANTRAQIERFNIIGRSNDDVRSLSGGNQQRALLALTPPNLRLLLLEHPTRGLDVESTAWVWEQLLARRADGTAIVFISADLDEIVDYSDRVLVFFGGEVTGIDDVSTTTVEALGYLIGGKTMETIREGRHGEPVDVQ